jgi:hypothetical protein
VIFFVSLGYAVRPIKAFVPLVLSFPFLICAGVCEVAPRDGISVLFVNYLTLAVAISVCASTRRTTRQFVSVAAASTLATFLVAGLLHMPMYHEHQKLLEEYPFVDVGMRLNYGSRMDDSGVPSQNEAQMPTVEATAAPKVRSLHDVFRSAEDLGQRQVQMIRRELALHSLERVHSGFVDDFIGTEGFGNLRMDRLPADRKYIELPDTPSLTLPKPANVPLIESPVERADLAAGDARRNGEAAVPRQESALQAPEFDLLMRTHERGFLDFVNPEGFGYVASRSRVLGFQPHGFRELPTVAATEQASSPWQVASLELVSLLKHNPPAAYVSKHLPRMDELRDAPTRPLDLFETDALTKLRAGEELIVESTDDEIRMLGPLRAFQECLQCHQVQGGALLGAFTYRLRPASPARKPMQVEPLL